MIHVFEYMFATSFRIHFEGFCDQSQVIDLIQSAFIVIVCSNTLQLTSHLTAIYLTIYLIIYNFRLNSIEKLKLLNNITLIIN